MFARPVKLFHFIFLFRKVGSRRKRDHTGGDEGRAVTGPHLFMVSILFLVMLTVVQGCQCAGGCERARKAENERDVFLEGQPNDPEGPRFPIRIRAQFTAGHKINRKLCLNP